MCVASNKRIDYYIHFYIFFVLFSVLPFLFFNLCLPFGRLVSWNFDNTVSKPMKPKYISFMIACSSTNENHLILYMNFPRVIPWLVKEPNLLYSAMKLDKMMCTSPDDYNWSFWADYLTFELKLPSVGAPVFFSELTRTK